METYDFSPNIGAYSAIESFLEINESASGNDAPQIIIPDDAQFELPPYDFMMDGFNQQSGNSSENRIWAPQHSAFSAYINAHSNAVADSLVSCKTLHKKCFRFLRKIDQDRKLRIQRSRLTAPAPARKNNQELNSKNKNKGESAFHHMIAERNRRVKLKEHFHNLYSLLPTSCRKDKLTILENTTSYLRELKLRVCDLEEQNESVDESIPRNCSNSEGRSGGFESREKRFNSDRISPLLYSSDDVMLKQSEDIPCQVKILINVQRNMISSPPSLLIKVIELLSAARLEILSFSHKKESGFQAIFLVLPKGDDWDVPHWQTLGSLVSRSLN